MCCWSSVCVFAFLIYGNTYGAFGRSWARSYADSVVSHMHWHSNSVCFFYHTRNKKKKICERARAYVAIYVARNCMWYIYVCISLLLERMHKIDFCCLYMRVVFGECVCVCVSVQLNAFKLILTCANFVLEHDV